MQNLEVIEIKGVRVLTTRQLAEAYGADTKTVQYNFRYNKNRYLPGKHYIEMFGEELKKLKTRSEFHSSLKYAKAIYLWTEKGALLHAKSLNTDKAWEVYDYLVDFYFRAKEKQKEEIVPVSIKRAPVNKVSVPYMENPMRILKYLLALADEHHITVEIKELAAYRSCLSNKRIAVHKYLPFDAIVYETAYELAHYFIHHDAGNIIQSALQEGYTKQAEAAACMIIQLLDIKINKA